MVARVSTLAFEGVEARPVDVQIQIASGNVAFMIVGLGDKEFHAELDNDPQHIQAKLYLADSYIQLSRFEEARPQLETLVKINPANAMGHLDLGIVDTEAEQREDALRELKAAEALTPNDVNVHWRLGRLYSAMGNKAEAKIEFDRSKTLNKTADEGLLKVMSKVPHQETAPSK